MRGLKKMKMTFTFEEKQQSEHGLTMAARKYNKYRENEVARRNAVFVQPWWFLWLPTASG